MGAMDSIVESLRAIVGPKYVSDSEVDREVYRHGLVYSDLVFAMPDIVVLPGSTEEVSKVVAFADKNRIPIVPKGQGEMFMGGPAAPLQGGIMLSLSRMDKILEINEDNMAAVVEGGCSIYGLYRQLEERGLRFPCMAVFTSGPLAGSTVADNSTGLFMSRYGPFGDQVIGLEVVLASGEVVTLGSGAYPGGYGHWFKYTGAFNPMGLFIQSMGTLGVITKVAWRIMAKPKFHTNMAFGWSMDKLEEASRALYELQRLGIYNIDMWNVWSFWGEIKLGLVPAPPAEVEAIGLFIQDGNSEAELKAKEKDTREICKDYGAAELDKRTAEVPLGPPDYVYWNPHEWRRRYPISLTERPTKHFWTYYHHPILKFAEDYRLWRSILEKYGFWNEQGIPRYKAWGEIPAALNPYPGWRYRDDQKEDLWKAIEEFHGEIIRRGYMPYCMGPLWSKEVLQRLGPQYELMKRIKKLLDPNNIMNPGQLF